jgi:L-malate glycosyltransferase
MPLTDNKINIAFVLWTLEGMGGSERVVYDIARKLDSKAYSLVIVSFRNGPVREIYEKLGAKVYVIPKQKRIDFRFVYKIRKALLDENTHIVSAHHFSPLFYSFLVTRWTKIKLVYTEHSRWQLEHLSFIKKTLNRILLTKVNKVIAISKQIEDYYLNTLLLKKKHVCLISNGVDLAIYKERNCNYLRKELGIKKHEKILGMVANIRPEKNHKLLISSFDVVAKEMKDIRLLFIGLDCMGGQVQSFVAKSEAAKRVLILGERNDVPELLNIFDVFCLPSINEGLPLTVLEAMASGVPVIGADVLGINEVITNNVNGLLFPNNDEKRLVEAIKILLSDKKLSDRLSEAGKSFVKKKYSLADKVKEYDHLFRNLCN